MKKIKKLLSNNLKTITAFIIGGLIFGGTTVVIAAAVIAANQVTYTPPSGVSANNVQEAIDDLYTKSNTLIDPSTIKTNSTGKIFASPRGIVIRRNGGTHFIKSNNWNVEKDHIQQIFSDISCDVDSTRVDCYASDFGCDVYSYGDVYCEDHSAYSDCHVSSAGSVRCS